MTHDMGETAESSVFIDSSQVFEVIVIKFDS